MNDVDFRFGSFCGMSKALVMRVRMDRLRARRVRRSVYGCWFVVPVERYVSDSSSGRNIVTAPTSTATQRHIQLHEYQERTGFIAPYEISILFIKSIPDVK